MGDDDGGQRGGVSAAPTTASSSSSGERSRRRSRSGGGGVVVSNLPSTINWAAPEVLQGGHYSFKSDVYAMGMIFYEMFSGNVPFGELETTSRKDVHAATVNQLRRAIVEDGVRPRIPRTVPPQFAELIISTWVCPPHPHPSRYFSIFFLSKQLQQ